MARIRTLKPEFWADEKLGPLDPLTRLVFLGLISHADDAGRLIDSIRQLDGMLFPYTDDSCAEAIVILARLSRVSRYTSTSGQKLIQVEGWAKHQRVDRPAKYVLPPPTTEGKEPQQVAPSSQHPRENVARSSRSDLGPTTYDLGPGSVEPPAHAREADGPESAFGSLGDYAVRAIKGLYGWPPEEREGTDERIWSGTPPGKRVQCLRIAVQRIEGEGRAYQGKLFRSVLASVVEEQHADPARASPAPLMSDEEWDADIERRRQAST